MRLRAWISPNPNPPGERAARLGLRARVNQGRGRWPGKGWVKVPILAVTSTVLTPAPPPTPLPTASTTCSADLRAERLRTSLRDRGRLRGGAQREVVVAEEHHDLVRVPQLPREERELAQRHHHLVLNPLRQRAQRALQLLVLSERASQPLYLHPTLAQGLLVPREGTRERLHLRGSVIGVPIPQRRGGISPSWRRTHSRACRLCTGTPLRDTEKGNWLPSLPCNGSCCNCGVAGGSCVCCSGYRVTINTC